MLDFIFVQFKGRIDDWHQWLSKTKLQIKNLSKNISVSVGPDKATNFYDSRTPQKLLNTNGTTFN